MQPLRGVRVLDLSRLLPGPFASLVLADLGATVDKLEDPAGGDYLRAMPPFAAGISTTFAALNRGKRSIVLDLKSGEGRAAFLELAGTYDVLLDQFRPGVLARLGLGHDLLLARCPKLVICALSGYGQTGPLAQRAGHDINYLARSGLLGFHGPKGGPPQVPGFQVADIGASLWATVSILAALAERARTGQGRILDIALSEGTLSFAPAALGALFGGAAPRPGDEHLTGGIAPYGTYASKDGASMTLGALEPKFWAAFCEGVGLPFDASALVPGPHQVAWKERVAAIFRAKTRAEWEAFAEAHDCCLEPVLSPAELENDPQLKARDVFFELPTKNGPLGQFRTPVTPRDQMFAPPPLPGEHTTSILHEAGFSADRITALRASGVVR